MRLLEHALGHVADGFAVFPLKPRAKEPLLSGGHTKATTDREQVKKWWTQYPDANIGLRCGDGLAVLDIDVDKDGEASLRALMAEQGIDQIRTKVVKTGSGGYHLYFVDSKDSPLSQTAGKLGKGLDTRAGGKGYVVGAGSIHPNGNEYVPTNGSAPGPVPEWLRELLHSPKPSSPLGTAGSTSSHSASIEEGSRNSAMASLAGTLRDRGLSYEAIRAALLVENQGRCNPPLEDEEIEQIARSVSRYVPERPYTDDQSAQDVFEADPNVKEPDARPVVADTSNVQFSDEWICAQVLRHVRDELRYVPKTGDWWIWRGKAWSLDGQMDYEQVVRSALRRLAMHCQTRADAAPNKEQGQPWRTVAGRMQSQQGIARTVNLLKQPLAILPDLFDPDLWKLNTPGGMLDLKTGKLEECRPEHMASRSTAVPPAVGTATGWHQFLEDLTGGEQELIDYLQVLLGYSLTGVMNEKILGFICGADSDTGKSTFIRIVTKVMGTYAATVDASVFLHSRNERIRAELAQLPGVRLVTATEPPANQAWDEKLIKQVTGGDVVQCRRLYGQPFTYQPQFKILIVGNHEPEIRQVDDAMVRRMHIIPFDQKVAREKQVSELAEKLVEREGPQILSWMIQGCRRWQRDGIKAPESVLLRTSEYISEEDLLEQWASEQCEFDALARAPSKDLFNAWQQWCRAANRDPGSKQTFSRRLRQRFRQLKPGEQRRLEGSNLRHVIGIRLRTVFESGAAGPGFAA